MPETFFVVYMVRDMIKIIRNKNIEIKNLVNHTLVPLQSYSFIHSSSGSSLNLSLKERIELT